MRWYFTWYTMKFNKIDDNFFLFYFTAPPVWEFWFEIFIIYNESFIREMQIFRSKCMIWDDILFDTLWNLIKLMIISSFYFTVPSNWEFWFEIFIIYNENFIREMKIFRDKCMVWDDILFDTLWNLMKLMIISCFLFYCATRLRFWIEIFIIYNENFIREMQIFRDKCMVWDDILFDTLWNLIKLIIISCLLFYCATRLRILIWDFYNIQWEF